MMLLLALLGSAPTTPAAIFDACVDHLSSLGGYSAHIDVNGVVLGKRQRAQFDVQVKGPDALLRVREPASALIDRSDRSFLLKGDKLTAYDAVANERLKKTLADKDSSSTRFSALLGPLDDSIRIALEPPAMRAFFAKYRGLGGWKLAEKDGVLSLSRASGSTGTQIRLSVGNHPMLREVMMKAKGSTLDWSYAFKPGAALVLSIPTDARSVNSFYVREAPPKYLSPEAKQVVDRMLKTYGRLKNGTIDIQADGVESHLFLAGRRLREDRSHFSWAYDGSILSMRNVSTGAFYSGKALRVILSEYVTRAGGEVDPLIRRIIAQRPPYQDLFPAQATVQLAGTSGTGDKLSDIIQVKSPVVRSILFVRRNTHLLESLESETFDSHGRSQSRSFRQFSYKDIGSAPDRAKFQLDPGSAKVRPLPKVGDG